MKAHVFESGDSIYLISPVTPFTPESSDIEHFAFAEDLKKAAPNENLLWLQGKYVEADRPNQNGHQWTEGELAIKSLTPMFCPVTVMHDPRTAVGLIADSRLLLPSKDDVPRARIETALAIWQHRFPDIAAETLHNYENGELMQSMECRSPYYDCAECGRTFHKLPDEAERGMWCDHLAESPNASRILRGVTFTGTGLIFGSRGATGAYTEAHLETAAKEEIVAAHQELHQSSQTKPRRKRNVMDITDEKYAELVARPKAEDLAAAIKERDEAKDELAQANKKVEDAEIAQKKAETERDEVKAAKDEAEETARKAEMGSERLAKLGKDFRERLGETATANLKSQAKELDDDAWEARLKELEEVTEVARDAGGKETTNADNETVSTEETAAAKVGGGSGGAGKAPSKAARGSVVGGLVGRTGVKPSKSSD